MARRRLLWQLYPSYLLVALIPLLIVALYASWAFREFYYRQTAADLGSQAWLLEQEVADQLTSAGPDQIDAWCKKQGRQLRQKLGKRSSTRITVILPNGDVVGDSEGTLAAMDDHSNREEIAHALKGEIRPSVRPSPTLGEKSGREIRMMYVAVPVERGGKIIGVLRTSIRVTEIDRELGRIRLRIAGGGLLIALLAAGVSLWISWRVSRPLERLRRGAEQFARGDFSRKLTEGNSLEVASLAETLNQMAADLDERIRTVVWERNQREAILSSMVEGVLAVDGQQRLIRLNEAGARLLRVEAAAALGRSLQEVVRNSELQNLVADVLSGGEPVEDDIVLEEGAQQRFLHAQGTVLQIVGTPEDKGVQAGALLVLHDVTRLKRLENVHRDFVANVSHELKTPITSIKGFVETLLGGALQQPEDAERFLRIVAAQSDRLNQIIEDLLTLSRLERDTEQAGIALQRGRIQNVLESAVAVCQRKALEKGVQISITCDGGLQADINPPMLEQAVVNLIDNAVKYSPQAETVHVEATRTESEVVLRVRDHGCGIGAEHLPRLFERFYRVDKARSRKLGGTGLGLAIVKHVAQVHGGRAMVESTPRKGSVFSLCLPS